jgi:hypothetical protein
LERQFRAVLISVSVIRDFIRDFGAAVRFVDKISATQGYFEV